MIPDFKTYICESIWTDIQKRSSGEIVRKEDDVNLLDRQGLVDYIKAHYKCADDAIIQTIVEGGNIFVCLYKDADGYLTYLMYDHIDGFRKLYLTAGFKGSTYVYNELKTNYKLTEAEGEDMNPINNIRIEPKGCRYKNLTNKFFLEVLDFIIERIDKPLDKQIEKI